MHAHASCERLHCGTNSQCTLKPGSATDYQCTCLSGYQLVDAACIDIDECKQTPPVCGANATCANTEGSRTCSCNDGFRKNASTGSCENIDDCTPSPCLHGGVCSDAVSDFVCDCAGTGFSGKRCQDNVSDCPLNACQHGSCVDAINDYACTCSTGYTVASNGKSCVDCHIAGTCVPAPNKLPAVNGSCPDLSRDGNITVAGSKVQVWVGSKPGPVYFYFHGTATDPNEVESGLPGATASTKTRGGLVASWDVTNGTGQDTGNTVWFTGDFAAADQILACAIQRGIVDTGRIHVAGYSAGGMQAGTMLFLRSNYLASGIVYSGGKGVGTGGLQDPGNAPAILGAHGAAGSDTLVVDFHNETIALEQTLKTAGAFAMDCDDGGDHIAFYTLRAGVGGKALQFLNDHPYAVRPSPYASGIPAGYPSYCKIAQ